MNLIIDIGNSVAKLAIFDKGELVEVFRGSNHSLDCLPMLCSRYPLKRGIIASVITLSNTIRHQLERLPFNIIELSHETPVPVTNLYKTPQTLGMDRLAAVVAANWLKPGHDVLVIDAGTCVTYDFIDADGAYHGGNISPGMRMRFKALNIFTDKLPKVSAKSPKQSPKNSIKNGAKNGVGTCGLGLHGLRPSYFKSFGSGIRVQCHVLCFEWCRMITVLQKYTAESCGNDAFAYRAFF